MVKWLPTCMSYGPKLAIPRRSRSISATSTSAKSTSWCRTGFYSNRTDFIRTAIRNQLDRHHEAVKTSVARYRLDLGLRQYSQQDLEAARATGEKLHIQVLGLAVIAADVSPDLARDSIASIHVLGALQATPAVKAALRDRIR